MYLFSIKLAFTIDQSPKITLENQVTIRLTTEFRYEAHEHVQALLSKTKNVYPVWTSWNSYCAGPTLGARFIIRADRVWLANSFNIYLSVQLFSAIGFDWSKHVFLMRSKRPHPFPWVSKRFILNLRSWNGFISGQTSTIKACGRNTSNT